MKPPHSSARHGFTLVELLVVIAIIGVLIALLIPAVQKVRAMASNAQCVNNLKQIGLALHEYHDVYKAFPSGVITEDDPRHQDLGWMFVLLPYLEQKAVYDQVADDWFTVAIQSFLCPVDPRENAGQAPVQSAAHPNSGVLNWSRTSYAGVMGKRERGDAWLGGDGVFGGFNSTWRDLGNGFGFISRTWGHKIDDITDGLSNTVMVGERPPDVVATNVLWGAYTGDLGDNLLYVVSTYNFYKGTSASPCPATSYFSPGDLIDQCHLNHFWSFHSGGGNWLLCDASVRFMDYSAGTTVLPLMATISGGEVIPPLD